MNAISVIFRKVLKLAGLFKYFFVVAFRAKFLFEFYFAAAEKLFRIKLGVNFAIVLGSVRAYALDRGEMQASFVPLRLMYNKNVN